MSGAPRLTAPGAQPHQLGLSPFLYWWNRIPANTFFLVMVMLLAMSALLFWAA